MIRKSHLYGILKILFVLSVITLSFYIWQKAQDHEPIRAFILQFGYGGIFILSLLSGFNLLIPLPVIAFLPLFLEVGFGFWASVFVITVGLTSGDVLAYLVGNAARDFIAPSYNHLRIIRFLTRIKETYPNGILFALFVFAAVVPLPNEVLVIPLALIGVRIWKMLPALFVGNLFFNTIFGVAGITLFSALQDFLLK